MGTWCCGMTRESMPSSGRQQNRVSTVRRIGGQMAQDDLPMEEYRRAGLEITRGKPDLYKSLWSRRDDVTLANPFGPPIRGWSEVSARLDLAASNYRDGCDYEFENVSTVVTPELA